MKALYSLVGMYFTREGHMEEAIPTMSPTPRKREAIKQGNAFLHTAAAAKYAHVWIVRVPVTAQEGGFVRIK